MRYSAILARADQEMVYPWGREIAAEEALSDPAYLEALRGLAVTLRHPKAERVDVRRPEAADGRVVGTVLGARWDAEDRAVVLDLVVSDAAALAALDAREIRELSEGYDVTTLERRKDGPSIQRRRATNHVALVERGRMPGAIVRTDEGATMDNEEMSKRFDELGALIGGAAGRIDKCEARMDAMAARFDAKFPPDKAEADEATDEAEVEGEARMDAAQLEAVIAAEVDARVAVRARCDAFSFVAPASATKAADITKALALHLGAPAARLDAADGATYAEAWVAAKPLPTALDEARRGVSKRMDNADIYHGA